MLTFAPSVLKFDTASSLVGVLAQSVTGFDTTKSYVFAFYFDLLELGSATTTCMLTSALSGKTIYSKSFTTDPATTGEKKWFLATTTATKPNSATALFRVEFACVDSSGSGGISTMFIDNFTLTVATETSAL